MEGKAALTLPTYLSFNKFISRNINLAYCYVSLSALFITIINNYYYCYW